jgi:hypothetical protein
VGGAELLQEPLSAAVRHERHGPVPSQGGGAVACLTAAEGGGSGRMVGVPAPIPPLPYALPEPEATPAPRRQSATGSMRAMRAADSPHTMPGWAALLIYAGCLIVLGWAIWDRML